MDNQEADEPEMCSPAHYGSTFASPSSEWTENCRNFP